MTDMAADNVATWCADHLRDEERLLAAALPIMRAVQDIFAQTTPAELPILEKHHHELTRLIEDLRGRRKVLREAIVRRFNLASSDVRLTRILDRMPANVRHLLLPALTRVRRLADELVATNHRLSLHIRIYLDAYQRLLRDLTSTAAGSGRYGPQGKAESPEYRPLIQIHG